MCAVNSSSKARVGIIGNEHDACTTCDSRIGFGTGGEPDYSNTCGIEAAFAPDKAMGYILVQ